MNPVVLVSSQSHHFPRVLLSSMTITNPSSSPPPPSMGASSTSSSSSFPILAIALLAIMLTAFLLISYYIITLRWYCFNWQPLDSLRRTSFSFSRRASSTHHHHQPPNRHRHDTWTAYSASPTMLELNHRGLDEWVVRDIPTIRYKGAAVGERSFRGCSVCLSEFEEQDLLRVLPHCGHLFHLDCVDVWLLNNANCPLCRSNISGRKRYSLGRIENVAAPSSSPQEMFSVISPHDQYGGLGVSGREVVVVGGSGRPELLGEDFVVLEIDDHDQAGLSSSSSRVVSQRMRVLLGEKGRGGTSKRLSRMFRRASIMGDECIEVRRDKEEDITRNVVEDLNQQQQIRRSFSMDSMVDRQLYLQVMAARRDDDRSRRMIQHNITREVTSSQSSRSFRRLFFPFGQGRSGGFGSTSNNNNSTSINNNKSSAVLPI